MTTTATVEQRTTKATDTLNNGRVGRMPTPDSPPATEEENGLNGKAADPSTPTPTPSTTLASPHSMTKPPAAADPTSPPATSAGGTPQKPLHPTTAQQPPRHSGGPRRFDSTTSSNGTNPSTHRNKRATSFTHPHPPAPHPNAGLPPAMSPQPPIPLPPTGIAPQPYPVAAPYDPTMGGAAPAPFAPVYQMDPNSYHLAAAAAHAAAAAAGVSPYSYDPNAAATTPTGASAAAAAPGTATPPPTAGTPTPTDPAAAAAAAAAAAGAMMYPTAPIYYPSYYFGANGMLYQMAPPPPGAEYFYYPTAAGAAAGPGGAAAAAGMPGMPPLPFGAGGYVYGPPPPVPPPGTVMVDPATGQPAVVQPVPPQPQQAQGSQSPRMGPASAATSPVGPAAAGGARTGESPQMFARGGGARAGGPPQQQGAGYGGFGGARGRGGYQGQQPNNQHPGAPPHQQLGPPAHQPHGPSPQPQYHHPAPGPFQHPGGPQQPQQGFRGGYQAGSGYGGGGFYGGRRSSSVAGGEGFPHQQGDEAGKEAASETGSVASSMATTAASVHLGGVSHTNLYVRGLMSTATDEWLFELCRGYGTITSSKAILDLVTRECKGFGFVMYETEQEARTAMEGLQRQGYQVSFAKTDPRIPTTQESFNARLQNLQDEESTNIYISNLPLELDEEGMKNLFMPHKVISNKILRDSNHNSRGVGFARMETREAAYNVIDALNGKLLPGASQKLQVRFADSSAQKRLKLQQNQSQNQMRSRKMFHHRPGPVPGVPGIPGREYGMVGAPPPGVVMAPGGPAAMGPYYGHPQAMGMLAVPGGAPSGVAESVGSSAVSVTGSVGPDGEELTEGSEYSFYADGTGVPPGVMMSPGGSFVPSSPLLYPPHPHYGPGQSPSPSPPPPHMMYHPHPAYYAPHPTPPPFPGHMPMSQHHPMAAGMGSPQPYGGVPPSNRPPSSVRSATPPQPYQGNGRRRNGSPAAAPAGNAPPAGPEGKVVAYRALPASNESIATMTGDGVSVGGEAGAVDSVAEAAEKLAGLELAAAGEQNVTAI
ncbi:hypothetical protein HDU96_002985 [Phlyctochytrium bullatum]|nr:hypothetical protein HDU96_002985 [Phlyctochytrium bullatum]